MPPKKTYQRKKDRELILTISMFLLSQEVLKKQFWNVKNAIYSGKDQTVNIGISTIDGQSGTTLEKLRKTSKFLSNFLYENGQTFRLAKIRFFIDKEDEQELKMQNMLAQFEPQSITN